MAFVICPPCVGTKNGACIAVCPTNAIHPKPSEAGYAAAPQLYIDPAACSDCGDCVAACPEAAIYSEFEVPAQWEGSIQANADYFQGR